MELIFVSNGIFPYSAGGIQRFSKLIIENFIHDERVSAIHLIHTEKETVFNSDKVTEYKVAGIDQKKNYLFELHRLSRDIYKVIETLPSSLPIYAQGFVVWYNIDKIKHRILLNPHGLEPFQATPYKEYLKLFPYRILSAYLFKKVKMTISLGGRLTGIIAKYIPPQKLVVIPNAVNLPEARYTSLKFNGPKLKLLFVSRFAYNKGIDVLFKAIDHLNSRGFEDKIEFVLGGKGPLYNTYLNSNKHSNVKLLGFVDDNDLWNLYKTSDAFVFPTQFEGMPTVILEAMSYSMPIIVSDVGATKELVDDSNGFILNNKQDHTELADLIVKFYNLSKEEKIALSNRSYEKVRDHFTWAQTSDKTLEVLKTNFI